MVGVAEAAGTVFSFGKSLFSNKWFWIIALFLGVFLYLRKNWDWISLKLGIVVPEVDYDMDKDGKVDSITDTQKQELKVLAEELYISFLNENWTSTLNGDDRLAPLRKVITLDDVSTIFMCRYYKSVNKSSVFSDLSKETTFFGYAGDFKDASSLVLRKLKRLGEI